MRTASRVEHIAPFHVMECAKAAAEIAASPACAGSMAALQEALRRLANAL